MILNIKKHYRSILCFVFVLLSALYSFYTPSYAFTESAFKVSGRLTVNSSSTVEQLQIVPMTTDTVYYIQIDEDNLATIDTYLTVDSGLGGFTSSRFGAYYLSSNTNLNFDLTVYYRTSDAINVMPIIYGSSDNPDQPTFRFNLQFSDGSYSGVIDSGYFYISPPEPVPDTDSVKQTISCAWNIKSSMPNLIIRNCHLRFNFPNTLSEGNSFIRVHFNSFQMGDYSINRGNLDQLISADSQANAMMQEVQGMNGIGGIPSVDPLDLVQGSGGEI